MDKKQAALVSTLLTITLVTFVLSSCSIPTGGGPGTITLFLGGGSGGYSVMELPPTDAVLGSLRHEIEFSGPGSKKVEAYGQTSITVQLIPGTWQVTVKSYHGDVLYAEGSQTIDVKAGQNNPEQIYVYMKTGVFVTPSAVTLSPGDVYDFQAKLIKLPGAAVAWNLTGAASTTTTIDGTGKLTVDTAETSATLTVTASSGSYNSTATVTVLVPPPPPPTVIDTLDAVTDITAPVHDADTTNAAISAATGYSAGSFAWTSGLTSGKYVYGTSAVATITLTATAGYTFTGTAINPAAIQAKFSAGSPTAAITGTPGTTLVFTLTYTVAQAIGAPTGTVSITVTGGSVQTGRTLNANTGSLGGTGTITYQWKRGGTNISDATASTYRMVADDEGSTITVEVKRSGYSGSVTSTPTVAVTGWNIGDTGPAGGKIFYNTGTGDWKYLEAAPEDIPGTFAWANGPAYSSGVPGTGTAIGTGKANTALILGVDPAAMAAAACNSLTTGGYTDWFLPSKDELAAMIAESATIGLTTVDCRYWSSSEYGNIYMAWLHSFISGDPGPATKTVDTNCYVRAVRSF
ncbi:hypothetical protein AGMMS50230_16710 [Spirochaetia bacterium]|nr:hypothetical protein AGMMS50230_16710 [Spirochaetia bacterium]